jgi:hypothetical protein
MSAGQAIRDEMTAPYEDGYPCVCSFHDLQPLGSRVNWSDKALIQLTRFMAELQSATTMWKFSVPQAPGSQGSDLPEGISAIHGSYFGRDSVSAVSAIQRLRPVSVDNRS